MACLIQNIVYIVRKVIFDMSDFHKKKAEKKKQKTYTLTQAQIDNLKKEATDEAVDRAFILMLGIPVMVVHDKFGRLMKKEGREERFSDYILDLYDSYEKGFITLEDLTKVLKDECGLEFKFRK